ncbi:AlwI family type II restriction endonuclease [Alkaliphilus sp. MSJ-5]|uniref:AlwI family type II restriction endonuclease n=1 Tax=Alkaliphilus flagellatus TaxID=2841507 RepID=A0ABS6G2V3_9FIRM|nr:AlwI family type II restriction endonuclease [Alkaliphilus flagellatus]MBU5676810.1 AlwI family type II restriction endonuclease [Alkaliphilus flagellatus]
MVINSTHYCWVIGNTGFRESALYEKIESYLLILEEFKLKGYKWSDNQREFFDLMNKSGFMENASTSDRNASKAARLKTSPLEKLGLVTVDREITEVGQVILDRAKLRISNKNFSFDEDHFLENDGDIYLKQLLKLQFFANDEQAIHPFILFLKFLDEFKYLSNNEMAYILPLIICEDLIEYGKESIRKYRKDKSQREFNEYEWIKTYLINHKDMLSNVRRIKNYILDNINNIEDYFTDTNEEEIKNVIIHMDDNGKSKEYSLKLYDLFYSMYELWLNIDDTELSKKSIDSIIVAIEKTSSTQEKEWRKVVLGVTNKAVLKSLNNEKYQLLIKHFKSTIYDRNFEKFILNIFDHLWYIKILNNLKDYADHNTRYLKLSNILESAYAEGEKALKISEFYYTLVNKILNDSNINKLFLNLNEYKSYLYNNTYTLPALLEEDMNEIALNIISQIENISDEKVNVEKPEDINYRQWINLLKDKFMQKKVINMIEVTREGILNNEPDNIINCLNFIEKRKDSKLRELIDTEADIPTVFEYLVWKSFLLLGDYTQNPIKFANFSFDNDLKPVQHAGGGMADVIFKFDDHDLILEATLTNEENQRKLEMEPVPRHLAKYRYEISDNSYCIFVAPNIDPNVAVVHRAFKQYPYYVKDKEDREYKPVNNLLILPISINELKSVIKFSINNDILYKKIKENIFMKLLLSETDNGYTWYKDEVVKTINNL